MQLVLLVDPLLFDAVPAFLLGHAQGAGDVVSEVQPLLFRQVVSWGNADTARYSEMPRDCLESHEHQVTNMKKLNDG